MKKLDARSRVKRKPDRAAKSGKNAEQYDELQHRLDELCEQCELVLPELAGRVAALEHLLREKELVTRQDLVSARAFVRRQEE